ncbi:MAG: hypothetical protein IH987_11480 [Planctomycetes bacterium]|nr:hypothetical protein [Planctomycetota bacterium]
MAECPAESTLAYYEAGQLADTHADPIRRHLKECRSCQRTMQRLRSPLFDSQPTVDGQAGMQSTLQADEPRDPPVQRPEGPLPSSVRRGDADEFRRHWPIPDYDCVLLAGAGSYGSVWAVRDRVGVHRALKIIDLERLRRAKVRCRERTALEAYCRNIRRHPHLITIHHIGEVGPYLYYTMDLADDAGSKKSTRDKVPANYQPLTLEPFVGSRRLGVDVAVELIRRLLRGLATLHEIDLVHRDVKPLNVVFVDRQPKLADIGVLSMDKGGQRAIGTPRYMAPDGATDKTADVYAIGKVFYGLLAGRDARQFPELPPDQIWTSTEWDLDRIGAVVRQACSEKAVDRYCDASMMLNDLERGSLVAFDTLFESLEPKPEKTGKSSEQAAIQLGFAFARLVPWLLGFAAVMFLISRLTR